MLKLVCCEFKNGQTKEFLVNQSYAEIIQFHNKLLLII